MRNSSAMGYKYLIVREIMAEEFLPYPFCDSRRKANDG